MADDAAMQYLLEHELLFLATASKSGNPHVAPMFYAVEGSKIYFSAPDHSETARLVAAIDAGLGINPAPRVPRPGLPPSDR